ncbi:hypothetical protein E6O75_ATG08855 [Venturia nashicola]|uniref:Uncharacterized protein n=1 Tax=Venturia nashicola TaxID=86259 RepID=A0A4Z1NPR2_9PEZI|nr:hypothetical protein E6O75_ATG08855 [Venturia nashicola]
MQTPEVLSTRGMKNQVRIRGPKPDVSFQCKSLHDLESRLQAHIEHCHKDRLIPETVYAQFIFDCSVKLAVTLADLTDGMLDHFPQLANFQPQDGPMALSVPDAVATHGDAKSKLKRQRAVGRIILSAVQKVDGFQYFEKEAWDTKHTDGYRFKYLCRDSYQNKDRAANKSRSSNASAIVSLNGPEASGDLSPGKEAARLATYDCKGSIFVKFSSSQRIVDVVYQHLPIHCEPANPAALSTAGPSGAISVPSNGLPHEDSGEPMETTETLQNNMPIPMPTAPVATPDAAAVKPKKRKRAAKLPRESIIEPESTEQEDPDWDMEAPPLPLLSPNYEPDPGDGDFHRPSVVTRVPGLKAQMKKAVRKSFNPQANSDISASSGSDFEGKSKKPKKKGYKGKAAKKAAAAAAAAAAAENKSSGAEIDSDGRPPQTDHVRRETARTRKRAIPQLLDQALESDMDTET